MEDLNKKSIILDKINFEGIESLSETELLGIIIGKGNPTAENMEKAEKVIREGFSTQNCDSEMLKNLFRKGKLSKTEYLLLGSCISLAGRIQKNKTETVPVVFTATDVAKLFAPQIGYLEHEEVWLLCLNNSCRIIDKFLIHKGGVSESMVDIRIIMKRVLLSLASSVILVHNHPSGSLEISEEDIRITNDLKKSLGFFEVILTDHVILSGTDYVSMRTSGAIAD